MIFKRAHMVRIEMFRRYTKTLIMTTVGALFFLGNFSSGVQSSYVASVIDQYPRLKFLSLGLLFFWFVASIFLFVLAHNALANRAEELSADILAKNRSVMLQRVRRSLIEGILHKTLWNEVRLILNLEGRPDAVV